MIIPNDNIATLPSHEQRLVERGLAAMARYHNSSSEGLQAVIEYGLVLLEGRKLHPANRPFGDWIRNNGLDKESPWNDTTERSKAIAIAEIVLVDLTKTPFEGCPHTRPAHIMHWYRNKDRPKPDPNESEEQKRKRKAEKEDLAYAAYAGARTEGRNPTDPKAFADEIGVSVWTARKAILRWEADNKVDTITAEAENANIAGLSPASRMTVTKAIDIYRKRLEKSFQATVQAEVIKRIREADDATRKQLKEANEQLLWFRQQQGKGAPFTEDEFTAILRCLHPDSNPSADRKHTAFILMNKNKARLVKP